jgi:hypothetical protein
MVDFLGQTAGNDEQEAAGKFLVYRRLLRPLTFDTPPPMSLLRHGRSSPTSAALPHSLMRSRPAAWCCID